MVICVLCALLYSLGLLCQVHHILWTHNEMTGTSRYGTEEDGDKLRKWCPYFFHRVAPSHVHPVTELAPAPPERLADPGQLHLQSRCWKQESPSFSFRAPSVAQRSDRGRSCLLSGQQELFTREISQDRVTGREQVTLRKAVLHLPRARVCQARQKKALLASAGRREPDREAWESGIEPGRAAG